jgi:hypothetical protein
MTRNDRQLISTSEPRKEAMTATARTIQRIRGRLPRLAAEHQPADVHFHQGPQGQPAPCFDARCPNPRLSV